MARTLRVLGQIEPANNVSIVVVDTDPRASPGLALGVGSIAHDLAGAIYRKSSTGDTDWTRIVGAAGTDYGLDILDGSNAPAKALLRSPNNVCLLEGDGAPTTAGTGFAGKGSLYVDFTNGNLYVNAGTSGTPSWKLVTKAA